MYKLKLITDITEEGIKKIKEGLPKDSLFLQLIEKREMDIKNPTEYEDELIKASGLLEGELQVTISDSKGETLKEVYHNGYLDIVYYLK